MKPLAYILAGLWAAALPFAAQADIDPDKLARVELIDGGTTPDGRPLVALRMTLAPGWKTYWRAPGDAGIPPRFDWKGSKNLKAMSITWPTPVVFDQGGLQSIGYKDQMILPLTVTPQKDGAPVKIKGEISFGICSDVCVPATAKFNHTFDGQSARNPQIAAALAQRPYSAKEAGVKSATCSLSPIDGGLRVTAKIQMPSAGGREVTVVESGNPHIWASEATTKRQGNTLTAQSDFYLDAGGLAVDRSRIRFTVLGQKHSVDIRGCAAG